MDLERVRGYWPSIFSSLGIDVGTGKHKPCPVCGGRDRFRFIDEDGNGSFYCNQCSPHAGDGWALLMKCLGIDFKEAVKTIEGIIGTVKPGVINNSKQYNGDLLRQMYKDSIPLNGSDLASLYLRNRGLSTFPDTLRFLAECYEPSTKTKMPALLATFSAPNSEALTLQRTYLKAGGYKADLKHCKLTLTPKKPMRGGAVRLFPATDHIGIAEGIETAIAVHEMDDIPVWATLSTSLMEAFQPPKGIGNIMIYADNDFNHAGAKAAYTLANRLYLKGCAVNVEVPETAGTDFLDTLKGK